MSETMKAAIFVEPGKMTVEEVPKAMLEQPMPTCRDTYPRHTV